MSSDFGDDSGEAMLRWAERVGERGGARALIEAAGRLRGSAAEVRERPHGTSAGPGMREWARLDLATVADDPAGLEPALVSRLREAGVESIAVDLDGSRALLFRVSDADRVAAAVGAKARGKLPCVVVDCGAATTFTVLDQDGALVASTYAWIKLRQEQPDKAVAALVAAKKLSDNATLIENCDRLVNGKTKHFSNAGLGDAWYSLYLEEPKIKPQRQVVRGY